MARMIKKRRLTTAIGVAAIGFGAIGVGLVCVQLAKGLAGPSADTGANPSFLGGRVLALACKVALVAAGVLLVRRSRRAGLVLACLAVLSASDSLVTYARFLPPAPDGLTPAGRAGRLAGRGVGLVLTPVLYLCALAHLRLPRTRAEFAEGGVEGSSVRSGSGA
jgi:hypothetical protein